MFHVVLFEPEIPGNTGNSIRLCANTGAALHLIKPLGFGLDDKSLRRSGLDYHDLADVKVHANLDACLTQLHDSRLFVIETGGPHCYSDVQYRAGDAFLFGPETRGLPPSVQARAETRESFVHSNARREPQHQFIQRRGARGFRSVAAGRFFRR